MYHNSKSLGSSRKTVVQLLAEAKLMIDQIPVHVVNSKQIASYQRIQQTTRFLKFMNKKHQIVQSQFIKDAEIVQKTPKLMTLLYCGSDSALPQLIQYQNKRSNITKYEPQTNRSRINTTTKLQDSRELSNRNATEVKTSLPKLTHKFCQCCTVNNQPIKTNPKMQAILDTAKKQMKEKQQIVSRFEDQAKKRLGQFQQITRRYRDIYFNGFPPESIADILHNLQETERKRRVQTETDVVKQEKSQLYKKAAQLIKEQQYRYKSRIKKIIQSKREHRKGLHN